MKIDTFRGQEKKLLFWQDNDNSASVKKYMIKKKVTGIVFSHFLGFQGNAITIHEPFEFVDEVNIIDSNIEDISFIYNFPNVKKLNIQNDDRTKVDFSKFENLERLFLTWRKGVINLFNHKSLKYLRLDKFKEKVLDIDPDIPLNELWVTQSPVKNLSSLGRLKHLRILDLSYLRCLESIAWIKDLNSLEELRIHSCKSIMDWEAIGKLSNLKRLCLSNCGILNDIDFLKPLENLESVLLVGEKMKLVNGNVRWLYEKPKINKIRLPWRKDFDISLEEHWAGNNPKHYPHVWKWNLP